jgi:hypothetical protein
MDIGSLFLALALLLLVAAFVTRPLFKRFDETPGAEVAADDGIASDGIASDALVAQREAVLIELRDLDFDHATGKVSEEDYARQRTRLVAKGAAVLRSLAERKDAVVSAAEADDEDDIERLILARRAARRNKAVSPAPQPPLSQTLAAPSPAPHTPAPTLVTRFCPHCAAPVVPGDRFCAKCGAKLIAATEAA